MWHLLNCAVQGRGHVSVGIPCQDKTLTYQDKEISLIALADGAGSAHLSHLGAECVVQAIKELMTSEFDRIYMTEDGVSIKQELLAYLNKRLLELSNEYKCEIQELASTLLFVVIKGEKYILAHLGDGVIGYQKGGELKIATEPNNGEFVNETVFVTSRSALHSIKMMRGSLNGITGFVLMSDGTENSFYDKKNKRLAKGISKIMKLSMLMPRDVVERVVDKAFESTIRMNTTDDCSLALMVWTDNEEEYDTLAVEEKIEILGLGARTKAEQVAKYDLILAELKKNISLERICDKMRIKKSHLHRYINRMSAVGILENRNGTYYVNVK